MRGLEKLQPVRRLKTTPKRLDQVAGSLFLAVTRNASTKYRREVFTFLQLIQFAFLDPYSLFPDRFDFYLYYPQTDIWAGILSIL